MSLQVQSGVARTGEWWGHQHLMADTDAQPDIMVFAKGIASGFPLAGLAARDHIFDGLGAGTMGGTYGAAPMAAAAACARWMRLRRTICWPMPQHAARSLCKYVRGQQDLANDWFSNPHASV